MTLKTNSLLFTDPVAAQILAQVYSYDPRNGVIVYVGPEPTYRGNHRLPRRIDRDMLCTFMVPTRTHVPHPTDEALKIQVDAKRDFDKRVGTHGRVFEPIPARSRHIAWRLAYPNDPFPRDLYRTKDAMQSDDLRITSFTADRAVSGLGRPVGLSKSKQAVIHPLPSKWIDAATRDQRVIDALEAGALRRFRENFAGDMQKRVADMFNDDTVNDILVHVASKNPRVRALIAGHIRDELNTQMQELIRERMKLYPPLQQAWATAKGLHENNMKLLVGPLLPTPGVSQPAWCQTTTLQPFDNTQPGEDHHET